jgi:CRISPR-associated exonuclease Cas4
VTGVSPDPDDDGREYPLSVPISALEHVAYCERQAALIHVEATWTDSADTVRGDLVHHRVDLPTVRRRQGLTVVRSLPVYSRVHGLHGICDLVEVRDSTAVPIEYKVGSYRQGGPADVQLAGQAACLAEAGYDVPVGYVYSAVDRRRHEVPISSPLLDRMRRAADAMRVVLGQDRLPPAPNDRRCRRCSLRGDCIPELTYRASHGLDLFRPRSLGAWRD